MEIIKIIKRVIISCVGVTDREKKGRRNAIEIVEDSIIVTLEKFWEDNYRLLGWIWKF
jgi:hypothetical protein